MYSLEQLDKKWNHNNTSGGTQDLKEGRCSLDGGYAASVDW